MTDRFKFRVWDNDRKCFFNDDEVILYPSGEESFFNADYDFTECVVEQCIGSQDKNGKLIYEGDYIKTPKGAIGYLVWSKQDCGFMTKDLCPKEKEIYLLECEVIGNIHENADLLEKE